MTDFEEFKASLQNIKKPRNHKIKGSLGVYDAYKYIRKNKWFNIGKSLTEKEFYSIIRKVGNYLADNLCEGLDVVFPYRMGALELVKCTRFIGYTKDNRLVANLPVNWEDTLKLWYSDPEAKANKLLVRVKNKTIFKVLYNRAKANYSNQSYYEFQVNRSIKRTLAKRIKYNKIDAFLKN